MNEIRLAYLTAGRAAVELLGRPAVAHRWAEPSALVGFQVGGLAAHLAGQVFRASALLAQPAPTGGAVDLLAHFARVPWIDAGPDAEVNEVIRRTGNDLASAGPALLVERTASTLRDLAGTLAGAPADRLVPMLPGDWALTLDDFLVTRLMEIAVHADDLAVSVGIDTPDLPDEVFGPALTLLTRLAVRRHGQTALLRALARAERAPTTITAL